MNTKIIALLCSLVPLAAYSQTYTVESQYGLPIQLKLSEIDETGELAKFDSSLGTLTGAVLEIFGGAEFSLSATNNSAQVQTARLIASTSLTFETSESDLNTLIANQSPDLNLNFSTAILSYAVNETKSFGPETESGSNVYDLSSILDSVQDVGGGIFKINAQSLSGFTVSGGGGNLSTDQATYIGSGAKIIYTYTVPEPSSAMIAMIPGLMLCFRRKRA